ncbi:MAG: hypothetical protein ACK4L4_14025 [Gemmobacter sp.]
MPPLIRLYIVNVAIGFVLSAVFVALLLWFDVVGLRRLVMASDIGFVAVAMLVVFNGIVFAGVQFAIAVMRMGEDEDSSGGNRKRFTKSVGAPALVPVVVKARARDRRF